MKTEDFIEIANGCINAIANGYIKEESIDDFINTITNSCSHTNFKFDTKKFKQYIKDGIE